MDPAHGQDLSPDVELYKRVQVVILSMCLISLYFNLSKLFVNGGKVTFVCKVLWYLFKIS